MVRTFGRKKNACAVALVKEGHGIIRVNGRPLHLMEPEAMRMKVFEPIFVVGGNRFKDLTIKVRVKGSGSMAQVIAVRAAIAKGLLAYHQQYKDEASKR